MVHTNVIVAGAWNLAILSPDGIRRRLFGLPEGTPVSIEVAIDRPGNYRVSHDGITVVPTQRRLEVVGMAATDEALAEACIVSRRAVEGLPETPLTAAGVNVKYSFDVVPDGLEDLVACNLDGRLSDAAWTIQSRRTARTLSCPPGVLNLTLETGAGGNATVDFNFHVESDNHGDLAEWLGRSMEFCGIARRILGEVGVTYVEPNDVR